MVTVPVSVSRPNLQPGCPLTQRSLRGSQDDMDFAGGQQWHRDTPEEDRQREAGPDVMADGVRTLGENERLTSVVFCSEMEEVG